MVKALPLSAGRCSLVDDEDFDRLAQHRWHAWTAANGTVYARRTYGPRGHQKAIYLHREVLRLEPHPGRRVGATVVDHLNRDGLDNRKENLRVASHAQNILNGGRPALSNSKSGLRGVRFDPLENRWIAYLTFAVLMPDGSVKRRVRRVPCRSLADAAVARHELFRERLHELAQCGPSGLTQAPPPLPVKSRPTPGYRPKVPRYRWSV